VSDQRRIGRIERKMWAKMRLGSAD
jgi:hypothetical protein